MALEVSQCDKQQYSFEYCFKEAGKGRLFNIVVDTDETAKMLLEKYKTIRRITCIPLNRIQAASISDDVNRVYKVSFCIVEISSDKVIASPS